MQIFRQALAFQFPLREAAVAGFELLLLRTEQLILLLKLLSLNFELTELLGQLATAPGQFSFPRPVSCRLLSQTGSQFFQFPFSNLQSQYICC